jgi:steroid 5-alpha reductase family enzyme
MTTAEVTAVTLGVIGAYMTLLWLASLALRNASIVDIFWGLGFVVSALTYYVLADGYDGRKFLVLLLVVLWGVRLSAHIGWRNRGHGEDYRYRAMRERAGPAFWWRSYFQVFLLQGVLLWIISAPFVAAMHSQDPDDLTLLDSIGTDVWMVGFVFEAVGDWQLARFKADPDNKGKVMRTGLWRYTRHPNYFGDATVWWGLWIIAAGTPWGWATVFAPIIMTGLLLRVSGVALLERTITKRRPEYADYIESTSAFIPWFPKAAQPRNLE